MVVVLAAAGACSPGSDVSRTLGAICDTSDDCDGRCLPPSADYPDGFCTLVCNESSECPESSTCIDVEGGSCLFDCIDNASCAFLGPTWQCLERDVRGAPGGKAMVCRGD
jgi:hypothetical protein